MVAPDVEHVIVTLLLEELNEIEGVAHFGATYAGIVAETVADCDS